MERRIVALYSPVAQSGKSTVARELIRYGFIRKGFADALKAMTMALMTSFNISKPDATKYVYGEWKEVPLPEFDGKTSRQLQQTLGTEWGRELVHRDVWLKAVLNDYRPNLLVIDDLRFPNEFEAVKAAGGEVWRISRPGTVSTTTHPSEGLLDDRKFDAEIVNDASLFRLSTKVALTLAG